MTDLCHVIGKYDTSTPKRITNNMKPYQNHGKLLFQFILFLGDSILDINIGKNVFVGPEVSHFVVAMATTIIWDGHGRDVLHTYTYFIVFLSIHIYI